MAENQRNQLQFLIELPEHIIFMAILPRLSYKTLSKFKCVNKAWYETICSDAKFAQSQSLCPSPLSCGMVLSLCSDNKFQIFNTFDCAIGLNPGHLQHLTDFNFCCTRILSSSCGLLCILGQIFDKVKVTNHLYICNLAVGAGNVIPLNGRCVYNIALAFDPLIEPDCFQLVQPLWFRYPNLAGNNLISYMFYVYSSRTCEWVLSKTTVKGNINRSSVLHAKPITVKNVVYWDYHEYIIYFDPWKEVAGYIELPEHGASPYNKELGPYASPYNKELAPYASPYNQELGTYNGRITCTRMDPISMQVYVLTDESSEKKKWEIKHKVNLYVLMDSNPHLFMELQLVEGRTWGPSFEPFPYEGGNVLFFKVSTVEAELVFSYDLKAERVAKFWEFQLCCSRMAIADRANRRIFSYHNSLVKVPKLCQASNYC